MEKEEIETIRNRGAVAQVRLEIQQRLERARSHLERATKGVNADNFTEDITECCTLITGATILRDDLRDRRELKMKTREGTA